MDYNLPEAKFNLEGLQKFLKSNILLGFVVLVLILKIFAIGVSINLPYNIFFADITRATLENLANKTRNELGLKELVVNPVLNQAAQLKAQDMVKNQYFAHTSPSGTTPWFWFSQAGYNFKYAGENLAVGYFESDEVYNAWLNSPSHKENLLNPNYKEFGTAVLKGFGNNNTTIVVQLFGSQQVSKVSIPKATIKKQVIKQPVVKPEVISNQPSTAKDNVVVKKVLSSETGAKIQPAENNLIDDFYSRTVNLVLYNYDRFLQNIIFGTLLVVIGLMLLLIFFSLDFTIERKLVFRSVFVIAILGASIFIDKSIVYLILPSHILI